MPKTNRSLSDLEWVGGHPALDFVNTVHAWSGPQAGEEYLRKFRDLERWFRLARLLPSNERPRLDGDEDKANEALHEIRLLRQTFQKIFSALANNRPVPELEIRHVEKTWKDAIPWYRLTAERQGIAEGWDISGPPEKVLPGILSTQALDLLLSGPTDRVKECPPPQGCGWLFLDHSKNRSRQWCSMKTCGNLAKTRKYRMKKRDSKGT